MPSVPTAYRMPNWPIQLVDCANWKPALCTSYSAVMTPVQPSVTSETSSESRGVHAAGV